MTVVDISSGGKVRASDILCCWETETGGWTICQTAQSVTGPGEGSRPPIRGEYFVILKSDQEDHELEQFLLPWQLYTYPCGQCQKLSLEFTQKLTFWT